MTREEAIDVLKHNYPSACFTDLCEAVDIAIEALSVQPQPTIEPQRWIPCSERLPKNDDFVIVTILDERGDTPYRFSDFGWYFDRAKCWIIDAEERTDVIAWMPLPTPYIVE